jgi:hypothetical protein
MKRRDSGRQETLRGPAGMEIIGSWDKYTEKSLSTYGTMAH